MPEKKSDAVRRLVAAGEYQKALGIAKDFRLVVSIAGEKVRCGATARSSRRVPKGARHRKRLPAWHRSGGTKCDASGV
nr:MAG TPA: hypothetical protein [Caudoviricetes sp.]